MITGTKGKQYGLIKPSSSSSSSHPSTGSIGNRPNVFGDNDDEDEHEHGDGTAKTTMSSRSHIHYQLAKSQQISEQEAQAYHDQLANADESLLDYDAYLDQQSSSSSGTNRRSYGSTASKTAPSSSSVPSGPKYITNLLAKAHEREAERERVYERKLAREQAAEEAIYGTTEKFVTQAYREKLEVQQQRDQKNAELEKYEELHNVTKRQDLSDFYRNIMSSNVSSSSSSSLQPSGSATAFSESSKTLVTVPSTVTATTGTNKRHRGFDDNEPTVPTSVSSSSSSSTLSSIAPLPSVQPPTSSIPSLSGSSEPRLQNRRKLLTEQEIEEYRERAIQRYELRSGKSIGTLLAVS